MIALIGEGIEKYNIPTVSFTIIPDHVHLLCAANNETDLNEQIRKLKGFTSYAFQRYKKWEKGENKVWAQKFNRKLVSADSQQVNNVVDYINKNIPKHSERWGQTIIDKGLKPLAGLNNKICLPFEKAIENKGGFDVVIGNPPYVQLQKMKELSSQIKNLNYKTYESTGDLYCLFYELGNELLKQKGTLGFITSNKWMRANYGKSLRKYFYENTAPYKLIDLGAGVFESAVVDSNIIMFQKGKTNEFNIESLDLTNEKNVQDFTIYHNQFVNIYPQNDDVWTISSKIEQELKAKIEKNGTPLKNWNIEISRGITTGFNDAFIIDEEKKEELINKDPKSAEIIKSVLRGRDIKRYATNYQNLYIINTHNGYKNVERIDIDNYFAVKDHLLQFEVQLSKRGDKGKTPFHLRNCAYVGDFSKEKIIFSKASQEQAFCYDKSESITLNTSYILVGENLKYLLAILNSNFVKFIFLNYYQSGGIKGEITVQAIEIIPIPKITKEPIFVEKADKMLELNERNQAILTRFTTYLQSQYSIEKLSKKLQNWHELEFSEFITELKKAIKKENKQRLQQGDSSPCQIGALTKTDEMEWMDVFDKKKAEAQTLKAQIDKTDAEIDKMVYELYGLSEDEIKIVEESCTVLI